MSKCYSCGEECEGFECNDCEQWENKESKA
jgi:hypothetical protein